MDLLQIFSFFASSVYLNRGRYVSKSFAFFPLNILLISEVEPRAARTHEVVTKLDLQPFVLQPTVTTVLPHTS